MIRVDPLLLSLAPDQQSFDLKITNLSDNKVFFKVKSNNINAVAPNPFFGSIQGFGVQRVDVMVLTKDPFEIKIAIESCQVGTKEELELEDWRKLKIPKQMTVIKVLKPSKVNNSIRGSQVEKEETQQTPFRYTEQKQRNTLPISQMIRSKNQGNPLENIQRKHPYSVHRSFNQQREKSDIKLGKNYIDYQRKYKDQQVQCRSEKLNLNQIQKKIDQIQSNISRTYYMPSLPSKKQISLTYSTVIFGAMAFFSLGYLCALYN